MAQTIKTNPSAIAVGPAKLAIGSATLALVLVALLHFVEPEFEPSWRFVSEYANGDYGWMMRLAFLSFGFGLLMALVAVWSQIKTVAGKIGIVTGILTVLALTGAAFFAIDPVTATKDELTTHGNIHGITSLVGNPGFALTALLVGFSITRGAAWAGAKKMIRWLSFFPLVSVLIMIGTLFATLPKDGVFTPDVLIGWPNRLVILAYGAWIIVVMLTALKVKRGTAK